ncbi:uncharacterized protein LOC115928345 [Strongylocentrotus purpuratus]|uniref:Myb/SANT-like DNA-binding domain-containing protein n=1 Tax=Strongylocentrotus purpuratus TaxID=7668 RepID=A0A7M7P1K8_STRPU|nr:uncharacterized protein LOC753438 [Strongylocentrotus purpuratus]XP_030851371.1 uncharacterized protein LOC115928345 [Strongylocentrotus purpuratus]|eukprot:XP_001182252.2 PREDICTED: uncharacterized protein LOC753438 [Strongylocentrotus purpuratus]
MVKRRPNLTGRDVRCLADYVKKNRQALFGKAGNCVEKIKKRKEDAWALGLVSLEAQGLQPGRTVKDLRLTWNEMAAKARKYRDSKNKTGGGPPVEYNEKHEAVLEAMVEESVEGILGPEEEAGYLALPSSQMSQTAENAMAVAMMVNTMVGGISVPARDPQTSTSAASSAGPPIDQPVLVGDSTAKDTKKPISCYEERLLEIEEEKLLVMKRALHVFELFVFNQKEV